MIKTDSLSEILRSLEEISRGMKDANMKLDHIIDTYGYDNGHRPRCLHRDADRQ